MSIWAPLALIGLLALGACAADCVPRPPAAPREAARDAAPPAQPSASAGVAMLLRDYHDASTRALDLVARPDVPADVIGRLGALQDAADGAASRLRRHLRDGIARPSDLRAARAAVDRLADYVATH